MNIGRCLRAFSARSTAPRPMIGSELAVQRHDDVELVQARRQVGQPHRLAAEARGQLLAALQRAVGHARCDFGSRAAKCVAASSIISPAPTNSTRVSRRSSNSCDASRTAAAAMLIECAPISVEVRTSLATANERWNSWCSVVPSVPAVVGLAHRLLHLAEDLRLAQHHRVEPAGDAEGVARRGAVLAARRRASAAAPALTPPRSASQSTRGLHQRRGVVASAAT